VLKLVYEYVLAAVGVDEGEYEGKNDGIGNEGEFEGKFVGIELGDALNASNSNFTSKGCSQYATSAEESTLMCTIEDSGKSK
jgi:hypothetical protein